MFYKGVIRSIDTNLITGEGIEAIYRIINFADIYFFAQEISTGCIFPVYAFTSSKNNGNKFISLSYVEYGEYYAFMPMDEKKGEIFKITLAKNSSFKLATTEEINNYLRIKKSSYSWQEKMKKMEEANKYICGLSKIKEAISKLNDGELVFNPNFNEIVPTVVDYKPPIDIKPIEEFGYDLSSQDNLCNLIGREEEIKKIVKSIGIKGTSVVLLGESGSGKTSVVEKLALDIRNGKCEFLAGKTIFYLSTASLEVGTKYRGSFSEKIQKLIDFCLENKGRIILFIDEIHTLYGLGRTEESSNDAMNILKPYLSRGDITIIGATTKMEYEKYMANDPAFLRRTENVEISLPDKKMNIDIMLDHIIELEKKYNIKLDLNEDERLALAENIFDITDGKSTYVTGTVKIENPTLSKNILEDIFTEAVYNHQNIINSDDISKALLECDKLSLEFMSEFGYDLSTRDDLCNLIGRERELEKIIKTIAIKGNSVVLVGEPGSGKTAIVEKLALDIRNGNCKFLEGKAIFCLDVQSLVSGTGIRGQFAEKMNKLINICRKNKGKLILFIDEIHTLYGLGRTSDSSSDAMNILKPYLTNGDIIIIGATTKEEYKNYIAKDPAFARRLEEVEVPILTEEEQIQVLDSYALELVSKYDVKVNIDKKSWFALFKYIIKITDKDNQVKDGDIKVENPTISKRLLEDVFADAKYHEKEFVDLSDFVFVILDCDKLTTEFRKDCAEALKKYIEAVNKPDCIDVPKLKIKGNIGIKY